LGISIQYTFSAVEYKTSDQTLMSVLYLANAIFLSKHKKNNLQQLVNIFHITCRY